MHWTHGKMIRLLAQCWSLFGAPLRNPLFAQPHCTTGTCDTSMKAMKVAEQGSMMKQVYIMRIQNRKCSVWCTVHERSPYTRLGHRSVLCPIIYDAQFSVQSLLPSLFQWILLVCSAFQKHPSCSVAQFAVFSRLTPVSLLFLRVHYHEKISIVGWDFSPKLLTKTSVGFELCEAFYFLRIGQVKLVPFITSSLTISPLLISSVLIPNEL